MTEMTPMIARYGMSCVVSIILIVLKIHTRLSIFRPFPIVAFFSQSDK